MKYILNKLTICLLVLSAQALLAQGDKIYTTEVDGVCDMCKSRIENEVLKIESVDSAHWSIESHELQIFGDAEGFDGEAMQQRLADIGHDTENFKASTDAYESLDDCCLYRDFELQALHFPDQEIVEIEVSGQCGQCKDRIEEAALSLNTVRRADFSIQDTTLKVLVVKDFELNNLHEVVAAAGHDTDQLLADEVAYEALPQCCLYREGERDIHKASHERGAVVLGQVFELSGDGKTPLELAEVYFVNESGGTITDEQGFFELPLDKGHADLVVSFIGFSPDTIQVSPGSEIEATLSKGQDLKEVKISYKVRSSGIKQGETIKTLNVGEKEFLKAACCNLAESFETLPAIDVSTTDAVSGTKQVKLLSLEGPNIRYLQEQIPVNTGISAIQGLTLYPGTWIESMQINQGIGSIADGYSDVSGQINIELRKPDTMDPLYLNLYGNEGGRLEANAHFAHNFSHYLSTAVLGHYNVRTRRNDRNEDGFLDMPVGDGFTVLNRWKYQNDKGLHSQFGVKVSENFSIGGAVEAWDAPDSTLGKAVSNVSHQNAWFKMGYLNPQNPHFSVGLKLQADHYVEENKFLQNYAGEQSRLFSQLVFQSILEDLNSELRYGIGYERDQNTNAYSLNVLKQITDDEFTSYDIENNYVFSAPHVYGEYSYTPSEKFSGILGMRYDFHSYMGSVFTPRLHLKFRPMDILHIRLAAGSARRLSTVLPENYGFFASRRVLRSKTNNPLPGNEEGPLFLGDVQSKNISLGVDFNFSLFSSESALSMDYFYTHFDENAILDLDKDKYSILTYQQEENSYSHNVQAQWQFDPIDNLEVKLAYKWQLLMLGYLDGLREAPFTPKNKLFLNALYATDNNWDFDLTLNLIGKQRLPDTYILGSEREMPSYSPRYLKVNAQISKEIFEGFTAYVGAENLTNYRQEYAIIQDPDTKYGSDFDAGLIWGPILGRNLYAGIRYTIIKFEKQKFKL